MSIRILHLSDIHFKQYKDSEIVDLDFDIRNELKLDLGKVVKSLGGIDIMVIGGDVAFSGSEAEYVEADSWIQEVSKIVNCRVENVFVIPGNHDVARAKITAALTVIHKQFKELRDRTSIDHELNKFLNDEESIDLLLKPFAQYLDFALKYGAVPEKGNRLYWEKDVRVNEYTLRIRGVNSALFSNKGDDQHTSKLMIGTAQAKMPRKKGLFYLFLCHHPPQWLYDEDEVEKEINARARIQLFGHKHDYNLKRINESIRVSAGAVQPDRDGSLFEPRYNIVEVDTERIADIGYVLTKVWPRKWNKNDLEFQPEYKYGEPFEVHKLKMDDVEAEVEQTIIIPSPSIQKKSMMNDEPKVEMINPQSPNPLRKLAFAFLGLPYHTKLTIAVRLELIDDSDKEKSDMEKSQAYFNRAKLLGKLEYLWNEVYQAISPQEIGNNPFKK